MSELDKKKDEINSIEEHWVGMPEYNNVKQKDPAFTAKFKFTCREDFEGFMAVVKKYLYNDERVFDGSQKKTEKQAWYPLKEKGSKYICVDEEVINEP